MEEAVGRTLHKVSAAMQEVSLIIATDQSVSAKPKKLS
jgi:hypothetical protein